MGADWPCAHVRAMKGPGEAMENFMLSLFSMPSFLWISDGLGRHIHGEIHRPLQARQRHPDCCQGPIVRPYAGAIVAGGHTNY